MAAVAARGGRRNLPAVIVFHTDHGTSFFSGFKREVIDGEHFATRADARSEIFTWLNWYNQTRLHSSLGNRPPAEYEQHLVQQSLIA